MSDNTWTWMSGSDTPNQPVDYDANEPGSRSGASGFYDSSKQEFWLFGGSSINYRGT